MSDISNEEKYDFGILFHDIMGCLPAVCGFTVLIIEQYDETSREELIEINKCSLTSIEQIHEYLKKVKYEYDFLPYIISKIQYGLNKGNDFHFKCIENYDNLPKLEFLELSELALYHLDNVGKLIKDMIDLGAILYVEKNKDGRRIYHKLEKVDILSTIQHFVEYHNKSSNSHSK